MRSRTRDWATCNVTDAPNPTPPQNPLRKLPSVLSLPRLHRRLNRILNQLELGEEELVALLGIDPLAIVRGLRAANAPAFRSGNTPTTVRGIVRALGPTLALRLFRQTETDLDDAQPLEPLWRHAIATAFAARDLAERTGLMDPEAAYLVGLVHDLPEWLTRLGDDSRSAADWIVSWHLPAPFVSLLLAIEMADRPTTTTEPPDPVALVLAAELLACAAGYRHPDADEDPRIERALTGLDRSELVSATSLRRNVDGALRSFGFADDVSDREVAGDDPGGLWFGFDGNALDEGVISILGCMHSDSYRGIITALTAAAIRYGNCDSAYYAKWCRGNDTLTLRSKADSSSRRLAVTRIDLTARDTAFLADAQQARVPKLLQPHGDEREGLLPALAAEELLVVPLNYEFQMPAFLLLDRSLSQLAFDAEDELTLPTILGMTGTLLTQNLLLRRRRQRAQKFALTDPLTHLFNRRMGLHALEKAVAATERDRRPLTVLMCDLDHFKRLNDTLGHVQGDTALRATAEVLRQTVRKVDTVCRYGGEEFLIVLPDTTPDEATVLAARMFTAVQARGEQIGLPITVSIGLTSHRPGDTAESILVRADHALYASKGAGRNRFSVDIDADEHRDDSPKQAQD